MAQLGNWIDPGPFSHTVIVLGDSFILLLLNNAGFKLKRCLDIALN